MLITCRPPQAEGTDGSGGLPCKDYKDTLTSSFQCLPDQHYRWVSYPPYPYFIVSSFRQVVSVRKIGPQRNKIKQMRTKMLSNEQYYSKTRGANGMTSLLRRNTPNPSDWDLLFDS
jgi:hypothetical protein